MANEDKLSELKDEKSLWEGRRAQLDEITSEFSNQISNLQNQQKVLTGERAAAEAQYQDALKEPHKKLDQLLSAQDKMAAADANLDKTGKTLASTTSELRSTVDETVQVDNTIQGLGKKIETIEKIEDFKNTVGDKIDDLKTAAGDTFQDLKETATPYVVGAGKGVGDATKALGTAFVLDEIEHKFGISPEMVMESYEATKQFVENEVMPRAEMAKSQLEDAAQKFAENDSAKLQNDKVFHAEQLAAVGQIKSEIGSQIDASKAEMQKVMGSDWSLAGQKEFAQNEFNYAFQKTNDFIAGQTQERDNFFAGNLSALSPIEQQQNRTAMNEELHAAHYGLTRDLAVKQAEINVDLGNKEMMNQLEKKEVKQGVQKDDLQSAMEPLRGLQEEQRPNDIYMEANKIHTQNCPELSQNPPMAPQQQGPEGPGM